MRTCIRCSGTGRYLGNGMMMADCTLCDENGEVPSLIAANPKMAVCNVKNVKLDRRSVAYKQAIDDIMASNNTLSRADAVKLFDDAYNKGD